MAKKIFAVLVLMLVAWVGLFYGREDVDLARSIGANTGALGVFDKLNFGDIDRGAVNSSDLLSKARRISQIRLSTDLYDTGFLYNLKDIRYEIPYPEKVGKDLDTVFFRMDAENSVIKRPSFKFEDIASVYMKLKNEGNVPYLVKDKDGKWVMVVGKSKNQQIMSVDEIGGVFEGNVDVGESGSVGSGADEVGGTDGADGVSVTDGAGGSSEVGGTNGVDDLLNDLGSSIDNVLSDEELGL